MKLSTFTFCTVISLIAGAVTAPPARADDIDIFLGDVGGGTATVPNVVFLIDNTSDFSGNNQNVVGQPKTGEAELDAVMRVVGQLQTSGVQMNIGLALMTTGQYPGGTCGAASPATNPTSAVAGCLGGAYLRYGARDMSNAANFRAFADIVGYGPPTAPAASLPAPLISNSAGKCQGVSPSTDPSNMLLTSLYCQVGDTTEKGAVASKDDSAAMYELYKYFSSKATPASANLPAFSGAFPGSHGSSVDSSQYADYSGNTDPSPDYTPAHAGISGADSLSGGWALNSTGRKYLGPPNTGTCAKNYVIYIVNPPQGGAFKVGNQAYEGQSAGAYISNPKGSWLPTWTSFLAQNNTTTYIVDAWNANPPASDYESMLGIAATAGGGELFQVKSENALVSALSKIFVDIQSTNSAFAATALPASATNRSVDQNQVYLGVFRPDPVAAPRWFGNLKRFQIGLNGSTPFLADATGATATNAGNGFLTECSASFWTKDTSAYRPDASTTAPTASDPPYWSLRPVTPRPTSLCDGPGKPGWPNNPANPNNTASSAQFQTPTGITWSPYSDSPDGPFVEKGGAAEVLRRGNRAPTASDTWRFVSSPSPSRVIKTLSGSTLQDFPLTTANSTYAPSPLPLNVPALPTTDGLITDYVIGWDSKDENGNQYTDPNDPATSPTKLGTETRRSIHGDVVHSTPLPITYLNTSGVTKVVVHYGSNDGLYHATQADTGQEKWAFFAPEFNTRMYRLYANSPQIHYPGMSLAVTTPPTPTPIPKDYFFDGSAGLYQSSESPPLTDWIYPTMRRGGRMIYAFDVSPTSSGDPPDLPAFLWKAGCPDLGDDTGCSPSGITGIGQTWSKPQIGKIKNGSTDSSPKPMVVVGGGNDSTQTTQTIGGATVVTSTSCEDTNARSPVSCSGRKGSAVYVIDAQHGPGTLFSAIPLPTVTSPVAGSVVGDVALLDFDGDGMIDYAYLADTNGNVYRIDFVDRTGVTPSVGGSSDWPNHIHRVGHTNGAGRKFLFGPTLLVNQGTAAKPLVYVALGSGDREHPIASQYPYTSPVLNRFYLFLDDPTATTDLNLDGSAMENATPTSNTVAGAIACPAAGVSGHVAVTPNVFPSPSGWYMDMSNDTFDTRDPAPVNANGHGGEQVVTPAVIVGGQVSWGTNIPNPNSPASSSACVQNLGNAYGYLVNLLNGSGSISNQGGTCGGQVSNPFAGGGLPLPPTVGTVGVTDPNTGDTTYVGVCIGCPSKTPGTTVGISPQNPFPTSGQKRTRVYWFTPNYN